MPPLPKTTDQRAAEIAARHAVGMRRHNPILFLTLLAAVLRGQAIYPRAFELGWPWGRVLDELDKRVGKRQCSVTGEG